MQGSDALPHQQRLDGGIACPKPPAERLRPLPEPGDKASQVGTGLVGYAYQLDALAHGARLGGGHMGAVDIVAGKIDQVLHQLATATHKGAGHPERLAEGPHLDVHAGRSNPLGRQGAAPLGTQHAEAVGIVNHQPVAASGCECGQLSPGGLIPVHAEDPFRDDQAPVWLKQPLKGRHVVVAKALHLAGELAPHLLQGGVVEPVLPQQVILAEQGLEHRLIGGEATVEQQHRLHPEPVGKRLFQLLVSAAVAGHQGRGACPRAILRHPRREGGLDGGVTRKAQVVVARDVEVITPPDPDPPTARHIHRGASAQQGGLFTLGQRLPQGKGAGNNGRHHGRRTSARERVAS